MRHVPSVASPPESLRPKSASFPAATISFQCFTVAARPFGSMPMVFAASSRLFETTITGLPLLTILVH